MKQVSIIAMAAIFAIILVGCVNGAQSQVSKESQAVGSSSQAANEAASEELSSKAGGETESSSAESEDVGSAEPEKRKDPNYVLPDSDKVVYSTAGLEGLSDDELFYARNELFARHGAKFEDEDLSKRFNAKGWYRAIEPKLDEYGSGILNLVEATNAATLRRIELERGSKHVNALDPKRSEMYETYLEKAEEYQRRYGAAELANRDMHDGLTGLCLAQLVDFDGDGWEELLLAYHDASLATEDDYFSPGTYKVEAWSYRDGSLSQDEQMGADSTQATSSYFMLCRAGEGYGFGSSGSQDGGLVYYYKLSQSNNPSAGDQYWFNESDISFGFDQMQTITEETLATLGARSGAADQNSKLRDNAHRFLVGDVALVAGDEKDSGQQRLWAALEFSEPVVFASTYHGDFEMERMQLGPAAAEGAGQPDWEPYEGQRVAVVGRLHEQQWSEDSLTPCILEDATVLGSGEGRRNERRNEVAVAFATAIRTNYRMEDGEYIHDRPDSHQYISPTSELYEWGDGNDDGEEVLILGNPSRVESAEVVDVIGDTYIVDMVVCGPEGSLENEVSRSLTLAAVFNDDDLVEHAYLW